MNAVRRILSWCICTVACLMYLGMWVTLARPRRRRWPGHRHRDDPRLTVMLTGRFDSRNWCRSHVLPLAQAPCVREVIAVVDGPLIAHPKVRRVQPPPWLRRVLGRSPARSVWVILTALRMRPDAIVGYHFFPAALSALLAGRLAGTPAFYSVTAGPVELQGGGVATESPIVKRSSRFSRLLEPLALRLCRHFDTIVVRGAQARAYLSDHRAARQVAIIPGSIDVERFMRPEQVREYDLVFVGRLVPVKQADHFVQVVALLAERRPGLRAAIIGDGPLMPELRRLADDLKLDRHLRFLGHVERVENVLARSRIFTLTSRSEGLSIALAEAMAAGVVPVVADVGDLGELVHNGVTGWRIRPGHLEGYAAKIDGVLGDAQTWQRLSAAARARAIENNSLAAVTQRWEKLLAPLAAPPDASATRVERGAPPARLLKPASRRRVWTNTTYRYWRDRVPRWIKRMLARPVSLFRPAQLLGRGYAASYDFVRRAENWTAEEAREYQLRQLRRICGLAYARAPYYRRLFDAAGFHPSNLRRVEDLAALPTCDRETLREHLHEMCTVAPQTPGVDAVSTGGTGGQPTHFYMNADRAAIEYAHLVASWRRVGYTLDVPLAVFRGRVVEPDARGFRHEYDPILRHHYYSVFHMDDDGLWRALAHVRGLGPCYLHVYPSAAAALARFARRNGTPRLNNILGVIAESETVYPEQRRFVEETFGCRYFSCYGHTEKLVLAAECEHTYDYHVWPSYGYFELLDDTGRPITTPGVTGEIVGTGFINTVVPFIRYRTGDRATYVSDHCSACGRQHPVIRDIRGHRPQEILLAADGSEISWVALNMHDDTFLHVRQLQFVQERPGHATLRIVPTREFDAQDRARLAANLRHKLADRLEVDIELTSTIELTERGKTIYVDQRIPHLRRTDSATRAATLVNSPE